VLVGERKHRRLTSTLLDAHRWGQPPISGHRRHDPVGFIISREHPTPDTDTVGVGWLTEMRTVLLVPVKSTAWRVAAVATDTVQDTPDMMSMGTWVPATIATTFPTPETSTS
jgi:hypothetical protein